MYSVLAVADAVLNKALEPTSTPTSGASPGPGAGASPGAGAELASLTLLAQRRDMLSHTLQSSSAGIDGRGSTSRQGLAPGQGLGQGQGHGLGQGLGPGHTSVSPLPLPALSWEQVRIKSYALAS